MLNWALRLGLLSGLIVGASACSGGDADDTPASPDQIVAMWAGAICDGQGELVRHNDAHQYGSVDGANCILDTSGTEMQKRQTLWVFESPAAAETFVGTRNCATYTYVSGRTWVSEVKTVELATSLAEVGGTLCR